MDNNKDIRDRDEHISPDEADRAAGDILGVSHVAPERNEGDREHEGDANQPPAPDERSHVGSRDVTDGTTGGTGPDTGGTGVFRRGSGATGTDIGR